MWRGDEVSTYFWADLHLGHKNIIEYSDGHRPTTTKDHDEWIVDQWNSVVNPQDLTYILGDIAFDEKKLVLLDRMNGLKRVVLGNHDSGRLNKMRKYVQRFYGLTYQPYGFWMSHAPMHPSCLGDRFNVHGHRHQGFVKKLDALNREIPDRRYICVSVEHYNKPVSLDELREMRMK
jgi:calcineurin-like phosphoesterase family protein